VTIVALVGIVSVSASALVASNGGSGAGGLPAFNACVRRAPFLLLVHHGSRDEILETIKDRARGSVEGEVGLGGGVTPLGGAAAGDGRYVMSTTTPLGRDPSAIESCWDRGYPIAPET
jgi:hypothetical protein